MFVLYHSTPQISGPGEALATLCYSPTSRSSSPLDAVISLMSRSVQGCVQGNGLTIFLCTSYIAKSVCFNVNVN